MLNSMWELLPLVALVVVFWLFVIRPAQRRQRSQIELQQALTVGDEVMLTSGFFGHLRSIDDDRLQVALSDSVVVTVARAAVARIVDPDEHLTTTPDDLDQVEPEPVDETGSFGSTGPTKEG